MGVGDLQVSLHTSPYITTAADRATGVRRKRENREPLCGGGEGMTRPYALSVVVPVYCEEAVLKATKGTGRGLVLRIPVLNGRGEPEGNHKESAVNTDGVALEESGKARRRARQDGRLGDQIPYQHR